MRSSIKLFTFAAILAGYAYAACKNVPGSSGWPSTEEWASFNKSLGGVLLSPLPPGGVCHPGQANYDAALCPTVYYSWGTSFTYHADDPVSSAFNNWNNDSCLPVPQFPCSGQGYPTYVVNATKPDHVQKAINFARENNIRLNVKCSGHDYLGRSVAPNSLSIWVHHLNGIQLHEGNSFKPQGAGKDCDCIPEGLESGPAITFSAGDNNRAVYAAASTLGMAVPVAGGPDVCYGGYISGGGHSILGTTHGLAADLILELTVVTPDGKIIVANACQNRDLFWALRGGGGATFGVVISFTMRMYRDEPMVIVLDGYQLLESSTHFYDAAAYAFTQYPAIVDAGWGGYGYVQPSSTVVPGNGSQFSIAWFGLGRTADQLLEFTAPIKSYINKTWPGEFEAFGHSDNYTSFYDYWGKNTETGSSVGIDLVIGSRLMDKTSINNPDLATYLERALVPGGTLFQHMVIGAGVHNKSLSLNSVCPAWRTAYSHTTIASEWYPLNTTQENENVNLLNSEVGALTELAPNTGAYINEGDPFQANYHEAFWGTNYPRLLSIKKKVDPHDVFWCRACVGNDGWQEVEDKLCTV